MVNRFMCIKVLLDDGETEKPAHVRVVAAIDYDDLEARLAEAEAAFEAEQTEKWKMAGELAEAEALLRFVAPYVQDHAIQRDRIDTFLTPADQPRCFRCGHAQHSGDCVNTAPDQPTVRRCGFNDDGLQCKLPPDHVGPHFG
jgi:hypothetical protein